jgi:hypothetical protein
MYPARSTFRSKEPGSGWFFVRLPGDTQPRVALSQWTTLVSKFQQRAATLLPERFYVDRGQGICQTRTQDELIGKPGARSRMQVVASGHYDEITEEALFTLLCSAGANTAATKVFIDMRKGPNEELSPETVRNLIWFATAVQSADYTKTPPFAQQDYAVGGSMQFPKDTILPLKSTYVPATDPKDAEWLTSYRPGADALPVPPSKQSLNAPASGPSTANIVLGALFLGAVGYVGYKMLSGSEPRQNPRRNYSRLTPAQQAAQDYTMLHEGLSPESIKYERWEKPKYLVTLGPMPHVQYETDPRARREGEAAHRRRQLHHHLARGRRPPATQEIGNAKDSS